MSSETRPKVLPKRTTKVERERIKGRLRLALDAMIWDGLDYIQAAAKADLHIRSMRLAIGRPHVLTYLKQGRDELLASHSLRNIHRLAEIRDAADNMPAVHAIKELRTDPEQAKQRQTLPGVVIQVITDSAHPAQMQQSEPKPLIEHEPVPNNDEEQG